MRLAKRPRTKAARAGRLRSTGMPGKATDPVLSARLHFALSTLREAGKLEGARSERLSARVDPGLIKAARAKTGFASDSDLVNAALAMLAAPDDFGPWFASQAGRLPRDFELEL